MGLAESLQLLERYSVVILPALVVAEQIGVPLPAVPALLGVGALAANGRASIPLVLGAIAVVALTVDLGWYELYPRPRSPRADKRPGPLVGRAGDSRR
jgi:membrane protein DedA with SNARE-associated domain